MAPGRRSPPRRGRSPRRCRWAGSKPGGSMRRPSPASWQPLACRIPTSSFALPASSECPTSCSGRRPTQSWCSWMCFGGIVFTLLVAAVALGLIAEWLMLCRLPAARRGGAPLWAAGLAYVLLAGAVLLFLRGDPVAGRANVVFLVLIVWAGDVGA